MKNHKVTHIFVSNGRQCRQEVSDTANGVFHRLVHPETNRVGSWHNYAAPAVMMVVDGDSNCIEVGLTPCYGKDYRVVTGDEFISAVCEVDSIYKCTIEAAAPTHSRITSFLQKEVDEAFELAKQHEDKFNSECWKAVSKLSEVMLKYKQGPSNNGIIMVLAALSSLKYLVLRSWTYEEQRGSL